MTDAKKPEDSIYMLFAPKSSRGLRVDYPELSEYEEFKSLRPAELFFVWLYACKSSPYFNLETSERNIIEKCVDKCKIRFDDKGKRENFLSGKFGERISAAIPVMNSFEPSARIMAKKLAFKHLKNIKMLTSLVLEEEGVHPQFENAGGDQSFTKKSTYMKMVLDANKELPGLIAKAEKGFSIVKKEKKTGDKSRTSTGDTFAEDFHNNN
jgi:hypothetical protein